MFVSLFNSGVEISAIKLATDLFANKSANANLQQAFNQLPKLKVDANHMAAFLPLNSLDATHT